MRRPPRSPLFPNTPLSRSDWWRARYRRATALLLDDIHLIAGKERTQEELFNLFNLLQDKDRQLVFTAPAHPNTLSGLEERIVSRLEGGLVAEIKEPDREVKRAVLERMLSQQGPTPEPALIDYLADRPTDSVRSLVGLLQRVLGAAAAQDGPFFFSSRRGHTRFDCDWSSDVCSSD